MCRELVNEFFLTTSGQQLLMHQGERLGCSSAVWSELGVVCVCGGDDVRQKLVQFLIGFPVPLPPPSTRGPKSLFYLLYAAGLLGSALQLSLQPLIVSL